MKNDEEQVIRYIVVERINWKKTKNKNKEERNRVTYFFKRHRVVEVSPFPNRKCFIIKREGKNLEMFFLKNKKKLCFFFVTFFSPLIRLMKPVSYYVFSFERDTFFFFFKLMPSVARVFLSLFIVSMIFLINLFSFVNVNRCFFFLLQIQAHFSPGLLDFFNF